jgi:hypothetical protein
MEGVAQAAAVARATAVAEHKREQRAALRHARPAPHTSTRDRPWKSRRGLGEDPAFDVQDDYVHIRCVPVSSRTTEY